MATKTDPKVIWDYFKSKGLNDYGIAGLMGNLFAESGLKPTNLQGAYETKLKHTDESYTTAVDKGVYKNFVKDSAGYGLAQWTYHTRKQKLLDYAKLKNKSIGDLTMQLEFLYKELSEGYKEVLKVLCEAKSVLEASNSVLLKFERPADQSASVQTKRASYGQKYYDSYAKKSTITTTGGNKMKYNSKNKPLVCMQTNSTCYKGTKKMQILGVLWHSTGANNPNLKRYVQPSSNDANYKSLMTKLGTNTNKNDWNHIEHQAGLNAWIGKFADGSIGTVQTMPWDYRPWGCGSGSKGSCNDGWIQFEICEDGLSDKAYFNKVYQEAVELTAYLCNLYGLNPKGTVTKGGVKVPVILCHADSYKLGFGGNHGDVYHWFNKHGKTMDDVRNDVAKLIAGDAPVATPTPAPQPATPAPAPSTYKEGDVIKLVSGATYANGGAIPSWVFNSTLYFRGNQGDNIIFSTQKTGAVTGVVKKTSVQSSAATVAKPSYKVQITADVLNVRAGASTGTAITTQVRQGQVYTIIDEKDGWGKLKSGAGWISLKYAKRV